jgi:hypothetical protein
VLQFALLVIRSTHVPLQAVSPARQALIQPYAPASVGAHRGVLPVQATPQPPQL